MTERNDNTPERPPSLLAPRRFDAKAITGGVTSTLLIHLVLPLAVTMILGVASLLGGDSTARATGPERRVVAAKFVKLGKAFDPRRLPNRIVPRLSTAPPQDVAVSKNMNPEQRERPDAAVPPNATLDEILRAADRAQAFAEIAPEREVEGDPNGIEEGTARTAEAGDLYAGQLYRFFHRGWTVPSTIPEDEARGLTVDIDVDITADLHMGDVRVRHSSGNELFDQSAVDRINALKASDATLPEPPAEIASEYVSQTLGVRFSGRSSR